ncbi:MAG: hypothetical protein AB8G77_05995 [Rhodothermales bacterium]
MMPETWLSLLLGFGVGSLYGLAFFFTASFASKFADNRFLLIVFGGMLFRMAVMLLSVSAIVLFVPTIDIFVFVIALVAAVLLSLSVEVWVLYRRVKVLSKNGQQTPT